MAVIQNTLYLTTPGTIVLKDHLTLRIEIEKETRLSVPIHHLDSICTFGQVVVTPPAMALCWKHQVAVHYHTENGYLLAQVLGSGDTRYLLRRAQYATADSPGDASRIARQFVAGKLQNARSNLLRSGREAEGDSDRGKLVGAAAGLARLIHQLGDDPPASQGCELREALDPIRGIEGLGAKIYFSVFQYMLKQQREDFRFVNPHAATAPRPDKLLAFLYLCPGPSRLFGRADDRGTGPIRRMAPCDARREARLRPGSDGRISRPCLAERLALTLVNRRQILSKHFRQREGGAVEFTDRGRREVIHAWRQRKQTEVKHALFKKNIRLGQVFSVQSKLLARKLRGDIPDYIPFILK